MGAREVENVVGLPTDHAIEASGKTGLGVDNILEGIVQHLPPPQGDPEAPLRGLVIDSWYDPYRGAVVLVRIVDGTLSKGQKIRMMAAKADYDVTEVGVFTPFPRALKDLGPGEVGF